jgi:hypothetical protein
LALGLTRSGQSYLTDHPISRAHVSARFMIPTITSLFARA